MSFTCFVRKKKNIFSRIKHEVNETNPKWWFKIDS